MGASIYGDVGGASRKAKGLYVNVNGVNRKIKREYAKVNGVVRKVYSGAIGVTVSLNNIKASSGMIVEERTDGSFLYLYIPPDNCISNFPDLLNANFYFSSPIDFIAGSYAELHDGFENYSSTGACLIDSFYFYNSNGQTIYTDSNPCGSDPSTKMYFSELLHDVTRIKISFEYQKRSYIGDNAYVSFAIGGFPNATGLQFLYNGAELHL